MPKKIRWGRVGAALCSLAVPPLAALALFYGSLPEAQTRDLPGRVDCETGALADLGLLAEASECRTWTEPESLMETFKLARLKLESLRERATGSEAPAAADEALALWRLGTRMERNGGLVDVGVGAAIGQFAAEVVEVALEEGAWTDRELAELDDALQDLARVPLDPRALATREEAAAGPMMVEILAHGQLFQAVWVIRSAGTYLDAAEQVAAVGPSGAARLRVMEALGEQDQVQELVAQLILDSDAARNRAIGLSAAAGMRRHVDRHGGCIEHLQEVVDLRPAPPMTLDQRSCLVVVEARPDGKPEIYGPFSP